MKFEIEKLEKAIGYTFTDRKKLETALTHSSYSNEQKAKGIPSECNERLEFLGDAEGLADELSYPDCVFRRRTFHSQAY